MFDPHDFFSLAATLVSSGKGESYPRTAIGRAYYACHLTARDRLFGPDGIEMTKARRKKLVGPKGGGVHEVVVQAVSRAPGIPSGRAKIFSDQLAELRDMRMQADYRLDTQHAKTQALFTQYGVPDWIGLAHQALALASNLLPVLKMLQRLP